MMLANGLIGFVVGVAGGLIGLGGAELRLPYLVGALHLTPHQAVPINLAISLLTVVAALPARATSVPWSELSPFLSDSLVIVAGAVLAAWMGAGWLRRLSGRALGLIIFGLLVVLGLGLMLEAVIPFVSDGLLPSAPWLRLAAGIVIGLLIGAISSVLGVAGGEVIIPSLVFGYGVPVKTAGSLSILISLPTIIVGILRHARHDAYDRRSMIGIVAPMGIGSVAGAIVGGLLVGLIPSTAIKLLLGALLVWSAIKVFAKQPRRAGTPGLEATTSK